MKKLIAILGSTGSIGTQALDVIGKHSGRFEVEVLTARSNANLLIEQAMKFSPNHVVITDESKYKFVKEALEHLPIKVYTGEQSLKEIVEMPSIDLVLTAIVGYSGLLPTINAIKAGKPVAIANKETLVVAGEIITRLAAENNVPILPVDSEHSAIFQCIMGEFHNKIEKIILTASGGPFRGKEKKYLEKVKPTEALNHPNWCMGSKVSIDCATLMNKGLEAIEAKWLFHLKPEQIDVVIHPQSIIHSMVQFEDSSIKAQMGIPDMRLPIQFALSYPERYKSEYARFDFSKYPSLTFEKPDTSLFRNLNIAYQSMQQGGNMPCIMNAANEIAVEAFLKEKIGFLQITDLIEKSMEKMPFIISPSLQDYHTTDRETRKFALSII